MIESTNRKNILSLEQKKYSEPSLGSLKQFTVGAIVGAVAGSPVKIAGIVLSLIFFPIRQSQEQQSSLPSKDGVFYDKQKIKDATCPRLEQYRQKIEQLEWDKQGITPESLKFKDDLYYTSWSLSFSIVEELVCRGLIQDLLLHQGFKKLIKTLAPGKEWIADSTLAKITRVVLSAAVFSFMHNLNSGRISDGELNLQLRSTFATGLFYGIIKESRLGIIGSIGAHMANNGVAMYFKLWNHC